MSGIQLLRAGCVVFCAAMVMAAGVIIAVVAQWPLTVRAMIIAIMALCIMAGSGLTAMGSVKTAAGYGWQPRITPGPRRTPGGLMSFAPPRPVG